MALAFVAVNALHLDYVGCLAVNMYLLLLTFACLYEFRSDSKLLKVFVFSLRIIFQLL